MGLEISISKKGLMKFGIISSIIFSLVFIGFLVANFILPVSAVVQPGTEVPYKNDTGGLVPLWVNTSGLEGKTDMFFTNNSQVFIVANFSCTAVEEGCNASMNATANFSAIGGSHVRLGLFKANGTNTGGTAPTWAVFEFNETVNATSAINQIVAKQVTVNATSANGTTINFAQQPIPISAPVILVNMSTFGCPPSDAIGMTYPVAPGWNISNPNVHWGIPASYPSGIVTTPIQALGCTQNTTLCAMAPVGPGTWDPAANGGVGQWDVCAPVFGGSTTNLTAIAATGNMSAIQGFTVDVPGKGKIVFNTNISFASQTASQAVMEFAMKSLISGGKVGMNDTEWNGSSGRPNLNLSATLTIYNISQYGIVGRGRPQIFRFPTHNSVVGGAACPASICSGFTWDGENISFTVTSFSDYGLNDSINVTLSPTIANTTVASPTLPFSTDYSGSRINFTYTPDWSSDVTVQNCTLYGNFTGATTYAANATNQSALVDHAVNGIVNNVTDGNYTWNVYCFIDTNNYDYDGNSTTLVAIPPIVNNTVPSANITGSSAQLFSANVYDYNLNVSNVTMRYNLPTQTTFPNSQTLTCYNFTTARNTFVCNVTLNLAGYNPGSQLTYYFEATDNATNYASSGTASSPYTATIDRAAPTYTSWATNVTNATTIRKGTIIGLSAQWNDNILLQKYMLSTNETGGWINQTAVSFTTGNWTNVSIDTSGFSVGTGFQAKIYANDTANNQDVTTVFQWTIDNTAPNPQAISTNTTNGTTIANRTSISLSANWTDNTGLGYYWISSNSTGSWVNTSAVAFAASNNSNSSGTITATAAVGKTFLAYFFANDTSGNENSSQVFQWTIDNTVPTFANNGTNSTTSYVNANGVLLYANWTDNVGLDYAWLETNATGTLRNVTSGTYGPIHLGTSQTWSNFSWRNTTVASGTVIQWRIIANDTSNNTNATGWATFTFDKVAPTITITYPVNNTYNASLANYWINGTVYDDVAMSAAPVNISIAGTNGTSFSVYSFTGDNSTAFSIRNTSASAVSNDGQFTVTLGYADLAGNVTNTTIIFYKDTAVPSAVYGLKNSSATSGTYQPSSSQVIQALVTDNVMTNQTITLNYWTAGGSTLTALMTGTPGTTTIYSTTIDTSNLTSDGQWVKYYISGVDNVSNSISATNNNATSPLANITISNYCGNNGTALSYCSYTEGWQALSVGPAINQYHEVHWTTSQLSKASSLGGDYNISTVLSGISGKYSYVYYKNENSSGIQWLSYDPNIAWNLNTLRFANNTNDVYYINTTSIPATIRIS